ncbi:hypothetical protein [Micromonospora sp. NPDC051296]|uniref:hypothetical protein n=1 Tax=Micromonospora sp. NPDC051296 TaxID=3155046 RepID=UPI0034194D5F
MPASFWEHEPVRQALAERHLGRVIRAYRYHPYHGRNPLPQTVVAGWLGITQAQLSRVENGPPLVHLDRLSHWATLLKIPEPQLWFSLPSRTPTKQTQHIAVELLAGAPQGIDLSGGLPTTLEATPHEGGGTTDRRQFTALAALAGFGGNSLFDALMMADRKAEVVGMEHVRFAGSLVERFRQADAALGADELCDVAMGVHTRLSTWAARSQYSRGLGEALQSALADLANQVAWLAIDGERRQQARPYLNDAITRARIADDPREEVRALACLSLLVREDHPSESLHCAEAALRASRGWATARLRTLLRLRTAHAYAQLNDVGGFDREMTKARHEFDHGPHEDDLPFLQFVTAQELTGIQGLSCLALGRAARAVESFRAISSGPRAGHRRNQVYYTVRLAEAEYRCGDIHSAAQTGLRALPEVRAISSGRTMRHFAQVKSHLDRERSASAREFVDAHGRAFQR